MDRNEVLQLINQKMEEKSREGRYSVSNVPFHTHNNLDSPVLHFVDLGDTPHTYQSQTGDMLLVNNTATGLSFFTGQFSVAATTNGVTAVNVFTSAGAPYAMTVTAVFLIAQDATASNITLKQAANTVVTIAKGVTAGALVGGVSLTNTVYAKGDACTVVSSGTGNATVIIIYTT